MPLLGGGVPTGKPSGGWAKTDLASAVQASLSKADAAVPTASIGDPGGVAGLDSTARVPLAQLPIVVLTEADFQALATKQPGTIYLRTP